MLGMVAVAVMLRVVVGDVDDAGGDAGAHDAESFSRWW